MILKGKEDLRVQRTIRAIKESFSELILDKPYEKITVKMLSERAGINKKTFYYYYHSLDALLHEMQDELFDEYLGRLPMLTPKKEEMEMAIDVFLRFLVEKGSSSIRIACQDKTGMIYRKIVDLDQKMGGTIKKLWDSQPRFNQAGLVIYLNLIILHGIEYWEIKGRPTPVDEMVERVTVLSVSGAYGLLEYSREKKAKGAQETKKSATKANKSATTKKNATSARKKQ